MTAVEVRVDDRVILISAVAACTGYLLLQWHRSQYVLRSAESSQPDRSHQLEAAAADPTNTEAAWVSRLLEQHFSSRSRGDDPFADLPLVEAVAAANTAFAPRLAALVERHCAALQDFNGEAGETVALSLGCGVGGTATALADSFQHVVAVDASQLCVDAAKALQSQGCLSYRPLLPDGPTGPRRMAQLPPDIDAGRINYVRADPEAFVSEVDPASADAIVVVGLLRRLARPTAFLEAVAPLLRPQGILAIATDYSWDPHITEPGDRLTPPGGGKQNGGGRDGRPHELAAILESLGFVLVAESELPSASRHDGPRRWHVSIQHCTIWRQQL